jgi:hypothetical protein
VYIVGSETYFGAPAQEYGRLLAFLGLSPFELASFARPKAHPSSPMAPSTLQTLGEYYAPHDERLVKLLGRPLHWTR